MTNATKAGDVPAKMFSFGKASMWWILLLKTPVGYALSNEHSATINTQLK